MTGQDENYEGTLQLLLKKFEPTEAALIILTASQAPYTVHPGHQLIEGAYYNESFMREGIENAAAEHMHEQRKGKYYKNHFTLDDVKLWVADGTKNERAEKMMSCIHDFQKEAEKASHTH
ncbi:MAG: hypothetical protein ACRBDL_03365 [Alphaproteobacteria bacterium]